MLIENLTDEDIAVLREVLTEDVHQCAKPYLSYSSRISRGGLRNPLNEHTDKLSGLGFISLDEEVWPHGTRTWLITDAGRDFLADYGSNPKD